MCKHDEKKCPRCGVGFECKVGTITECQCSVVKLSDKERNYLATQYDDCLCANCMNALKAEFHNRNFAQKLKKMFSLSVER